MRSDDPIPSMPMASHLVQVMLDGIQQRFERHYEDEAGQFLLWALLHPLPDGLPPATFGAAARRLQDRDSLKREIRAITEETGGAYHRLGMRVQFSFLNYKMFDVVVGMAAAALDDYIARPSVRTYSAMIQLDADQQEALQGTLSYYHESEQQFLSDCLRSGIAHAQERMRSSLEGLTVETDETGAVRNPDGSLSEMLDDDIPY